MRKLRTVVTLIAVIAGFILSSSPMVRAEVGVTDTEILIGNSSPQSGPTAFMSLNSNMGILSVFKSVNERGGVHGRKLKYISYDDGYQPPKTVANVKRLIDRDHVFILFHIGGTPTTLAAYKYSHPSGVPIFIPNTWANVLINPLKQDLFMMGADYTDQMRALINYLAKDRGMKRIALFYQDDAYGAEGLRAAKEQTKKLGITLVAKEPYRRLSVDFSPQAAKLKKSKAEAVVMMALAASGSKVIREARKLGYAPQWAGVSPMANKTFIQLGKETVEGFVAAMPYPSEDSDGPGAVRYRQILKKYYPKATPQQPSLWGYTNALVLVEVLKLTGRDLTRANFLKAAQKLKNFKTGILPPINFSATKHNGSTQLQFAQVKGGKFVYITGWR